MASAREASRGSGGMRNQGWSRFWAAKDGLGAIEFAFIAPFLLTMLLGILDFGMAYWQQMEIANAADAGTQWAMANGYDRTSITSVATSATGLSGINVTPSYSCGCLSGTSITLSGNPPCGGSCSQGGSPQPYIIVNTQMCYSTLFTWPGLSYCSSSDSLCSGCSASQISLTAQSYVLQ